jgi:pimeloyl-ACP methyl ester carboxylesterase
VVVGWAVIILGTIPFAKYLYAPLGAGDRFNFVSAIGGALVWAGLLAMVASWRRPVAVAAVVVLVAAGCYTRVERAVLWHRAAHDALAIQHGVLESIPDPQGVIVIGPAPIQQQNIAAYLDQSNIAAALQIAYGRRDLEAGLTFSQEQFDSYPAEQRFDIRPVSQLRADTVVDAG